MPADERVVKRNKRVDLSEYRAWEAGLKKDVDEKKKKNKKINRVKLPGIIEVFHKIAVMKNLNMSPWRSTGLERKNYRSCPSPYSQRE